MNSEAAGTEWIRKADALELVTKWRDYVMERDTANPNYEAGKEQGRHDCADELAEVIARNVQPSPDNSKAWEEAFKEVDEVALAFRTKRNIQHFILRRVAELFPKASEEGAIAHAEACPVKVAYSADPVEFFTPDTWERLEAYAKEYGTNWCNRGKFNQAEARPVPQPATEPERKSAYQFYDGQDTFNFVRKDQKNIACILQFAEAYANSQFSRVSRERDQALGDFDKVRTRNLEIEEKLDSAFVALQKIERHGNHSGVIACPQDSSFYIEPMRKIARAALALRDISQGQTELTFDAFQMINAERRKENFPQCSDWLPGTWPLAIAGEAGELCNLVKKCIRGDFAFESQREEILKELSDIITYCDAMINAMGANTAEVVTAKFNEVSKRVGYLKELAARQVPVSSAEEKGRS